MTIAPIAPPASDALLPVYRRQPVEIASGSGVRLFDAEGRSYLDFTSGIAVNALGYGDPGFIDALRAATEAGLVHVSNLYSTAPARMVALALIADGPAPPLRPEDMVEPWKSISPPSRIDPKR